VLNHPAILERVIDPERGEFPPELARQILRFHFPPADVARYAELSAKAQDGSLSDAERQDLEDYVNVNDLLMILKAKAETSLRQKPSAA
jgi:hypothetical protein